MHDDFRRHAIGLALEPLCLGILGARKIGPKDEARAVDQIYVVRRCRRGMPSGCRSWLRNERFDQIVHGVLYSGIALFRHPGRSSRLLGTWGFPPAVHQTPRAFGAFTPPTPP